MERRQVFSAIDAIIRRHPVVRDLHEKPTAIRSTPALGYDTAIRLTGVCEHLPFVEIDLQKPFASPNFGKTNGGPLAVVEDVSSLVDNKIRQLALSEIGS
jgi:hypothetical protein